LLGFYNWLLKWLAARPRVSPDILSLMPPDHPWGEQAF
jgi:hypothetical protein